MSNNSRITVNILEKDYQVACPESEQLALKSAAKELDELMRRVRNTGTVIGTDRIAVMVALNLCHELQSLREHQTHSSAAQNKLKQLNHALDEALAEAD